MKKGERVRHKHHQRTATVVRPVKSRGVITIKWDDDGRYYDAYPQLLELIATVPPEVEDNDT